VHHPRTLAARLDPRHAQSVSRLAALWDLDGVLVDSTEAHYQAWRTMAAARGKELSREEFIGTFGMTNPDAIRAIFGAVPEADALAIAKRKESEFRRLLRGRTRALPGALELVRALHQARHAQAVASSAPSENVAAILDELGIAACFSAIACGDDVRRGKPDPEIFLVAAERLGKPPSQCVVLEDADVGVAGAKRAGMRVYAVTSTRARDQLGGADRIVDRLDELRVADFLEQ
jgi:beta-phosphoglucomutase